MTKKMKKESGFTLVEMLIVVAIIAILIAVSIPLVNGALEKAREATDAANERSFKAVLVTGYLLENAGMTEATAEKVVADTPYAYDAVNGVVVKSGDITKYGKSGNAKDKLLCGYVKSSGEVVMKWNATLPADTTTIDGITDGDLIAPDLVGTP